MTPPVTLCDTVRVENVFQKIRLELFVILYYNKLDIDGGIAMKISKNRKLVFIVLSIVILTASILPVIISKDATITKYSFVSIAFAFCSVVYAVIAFILREKGNLFIAGYRFWRFVDYLFAKPESYTKTEAYKKEFELSAFVFCATIPPYISFAFFASDFYSALSRALLCSILQSLAIILIVLIPPIIKSIKEKKRQQIKHEADRKEQERRESMGKWK